MEGHHGAADDEAVVIVIAVDDAYAPNVVEDGGASFPFAHVEHDMAAHPEQAQEGHALLQDDFFLFRRAEAFQRLDEAGAALSGGVAAQPDAEGG